MVAQLTLPAGLTFPKSVLDVSIEFDEHLKSGHLDRYQPIPTGFELLDALLGGGLQAESLMLVGGPPGVGKTIFALQAARNIAASGDAFACVVCFEHSEVYLYHRLVCLESLDHSDAGRVGVTLDDIRAVVSNDSHADLHALIKRLPAARSAWERIVGYWERLYLVKGHPVKTTLAVLDTFLGWLCARNERVVLFVDYLQKVPVFAPGVELTPERQIRMVTEGLKNLAMAYHVPVVAVAASDAEGLKEEQVRFENLWGGSSIKYEPDIALILNRGKGEDILFSIEKNRLGPTGRVFEQRLRGEFFAFDPIES